MVYFNIFQYSFYNTSLVTFRTHLVYQGQTVNQRFYKEVLRLLVNKVRQKRIDLLARKTWVLHHDNAPIHTALSMKHFLGLQTNRHTRVSVEFAGQ